MFLDCLLLSGALLLSGPDAGAAAIAANAASTAASLHNAALPHAALPHTYALRVGRAETVAHGSIPNAVILVEGDRITIVGEDLPIEAGIPVVDLPEAVVTPGFVNPRSRVGLDSRGNTTVDPSITPEFELLPDQSVFENVLETGVTTLGLYPSGGGVPGQAIAIRPQGSTVDEMLLQAPSYIQMYCQSDRNSKKLFGDAFELFDKYMEGVEKERDKHKKDKKKKDEEFEPPVPDAKTLPMVRLMAGDQRAVVGIRKAADFLHLLDVLGDREVEYDLQIDMRDNLDVFMIAERIAEHGLRVLVDPVLTTHPGTRRDRSIPNDLLDAGAKIAFVPSSDSVSGMRNWRREVGTLVRFGMDPGAALAAMTHEPAQVLGVDDQVGSIDGGKLANLLIFDGDPFAVSTNLLGVIFEGEFVSGDLEL